MSDFKVGDRVKIIFGSGLGMFGRIKYEFTGNDYLVLLDNKRSDYDSRNLIKCGNYLELINNQERKEENTMKKSDLKQGAIVQTRDGLTMILIGKKFVNLIDGGWLDYYDYTEDLIDCTGNRTVCFMFDIVKVFNPTDENIGYKKHLQNNIKWDWERQETKEMTVEEISKALGYEVKIVKEKTNE